MAWGKVGPKWWARMEVKWKTQMLNHGIFESGLAKLFREFSFPHFPTFSHIFHLKTMGSLL